MKNFAVGLRLAAIGFAIVVAGCATKPAPTPPPPPPAAAPAPVAPSIVPGSAEDLRVNVGDTVHFDYDKYAVLDADKATLQRQAAWLGKYPNVKVTVEGHADERGTREYNIALGARRAQTVRDYLISRGVAANRMHTISYGKERPVALCDDISCWSQNRRAVTVLGVSS